MKKILSICLVFILCLSMLGCQKQTPILEQSATPTFEVGKKVLGTFGDTLEIFLTEGSNLTDERATITISVIMGKVCDITEKSDYDRYWYRKYSYNVDIVGKVDKSYEGKTIYVCLNLAPEYHAGRMNNNGEKGIVSVDGSFSYSYSFKSNVILTEWIPDSVRVY